MLWSYFYTNKPRIIIVNCEKMSNFAIWIFRARRDESNKPYSPKVNLCKASIWIIETSMVFSDFVA